MVSTRVDQGGVYALLEHNPPIRVDQGGVYALAETAPPIRFDQGGILALVAITPNVPIDQAGMYALADGSPCGTRWAQIWTITRTDGEVFRFTSLDRDLDYGGNTYQACDSLVPSASENVSEVDAAGSMDLAGAIGEGAGKITAAALYGGLFDGATVEAWLVPWDGEGRIRRLLKGTFGAVEQTQTAFKVELLGAGGNLEQTPLVRRLQPGCRWVFGDSRCGKDLAPLTVTGTVDSAVGQREFTDAARAEAAGYFKGGLVTFTTGANAGESCEIKDNVSGGRIILWPRFAYAIVAGDQYEMTPGCTLLKDSSGGTNGCSAWANFVNYGGFLSVPTKDKITAAAVVKES